MNCLPVIEIEMRSAARRKWTFALRVLFAFTGFAACLVVLILPPLAPGPNGQTMLVILSYLGLAFSLFLGGFLTADCVSSEKRDGTLGLLFLTPLTGMDIVLGKMICHGLQMFYGLGALFPVFFLPVLAGGVTWPEVSRIVLALALAMILGGATGVFVSVLATESRRTIMSTLAGLVLIAAGPMLYLMVRRTFLGIATALNGLPQVSPVFLVSAGFESSYVRRGGPGLFWGSVGVSLLLSAALVAAAGLLLVRVFRALGAGKAAVARNRRQPLVDLQVLERNPYEWAILRGSRPTRSLGLLTHALVLFYAIMLVASAATSHWQEGFISAFFTALAIHLVTKLRFAVEATRQINLDRQSGAMELLLVTTLPSDGIMQGHQRAMRILAQKPLALLIGLNLLLELCVLLLPETLHMDKDATVGFTSLFIGGMVLAAADLSALRWLSLLHGLRAQSHLKAALAAFRSTMLVPWLGIALLIAVVTSTHPSGSGFTMLFCIWVAACLLYDWILIHYSSYLLERDLHRLASEGP